MYKKVRSVADFFVVDFYILFSKVLFESYVESVI